MSDNTPDTETVRDIYAEYSALTKYQADRDEEAFDRWLDQVKADAWDEVADNLGEYAEVDDSLIDLADNIRDGNPYREANDD